MNINLLASLDMDAPDDHSRRWVPVGYVDTSGPAENVTMMKHVQGVLGLYAPQRARSVSFYGFVDPASELYAAITAGHDEQLPERLSERHSPEFRLALDPSSGGGPLFVTGTSKVAGLNSRPPERHPGRLGSEVPIGFTVRAAPDLLVFARS